MPLLHIRPQEIETKGGIKIAIEANDAWGAITINGERLVFGAGGNLLSIRTPPPIIPETLRGRVDARLGEE